MIHLTVLKSQWIFKVKKGPDENSQRFKARLVVKDYEQIPEVDYHETYSPVVRFNTLRCLFAMAARYNYALADTRGVLRLKPPLSN